MSAADSGLPPGEGWVRIDDPVVRQHLIEQTVKEGMDQVLHHLAAERDPEMRAEMARWLPRFEELIRGVAEEHADKAMVAHLRREGKLD